MDDFRIILYVVGGIAYFIFTQYKKLNVKKNQQGAPRPKSRPRPRPNYQSKSGQPVPQKERPVQPKASKTIEDILRELQGQGTVKHEMPPAEEIIIEPEFNEGVDNAEAFESDEGVNTIAERLRRERDERVKEQQQKLEFSDDTDQEVEIGTIEEFDFKQKKKKSSSRKRFDLRKAIIYDAILKRPEY